MNPSVTPLDLHFQGQRHAIAYLLEHSTGIVLVESGRMALPCPHCKPPSRNAATPCAM